MPPIPTEDGAWLEPDDETDLADSLDTDEREAAQAKTVVIDEGADKWDRMLGLDVVPDEAGEAPARDQVPERFNFGLWIALGLVLGGGVAWSLGLLGPGASESTESPELQVTLQPEAGSPVQPEPEPVPSVPEPEPVPSVPEPEPTQPPLTEPPAPAPPPVAAPTLPVPVEPAPEPVPEPEPASAATAQGPQTGLVRVAGDAHVVRLVRAGRRYSGGRMPPGDYLIEVAFKEGESPRVAGKLTIAVGDRRLVRCAADFYRCQVH
jgi:hypothetical protein